MRYKIYIYIILEIIIMCMLSGECFAYWVWSSDTGRWENPKYAAKDTPDEQFEYAVGFYKDGNFKVSLKEFKKLIKYYPLSKEAPKSQYYVGLIMEEMDRPYEAFKAYQKVIDLYPYTELVDEVIEREFKIGEMLLSDKKLRVLGPLKVPAKDKAIEIFKMVSDNAPYGKYADSAIFNAGLGYKEIADYNNAILMFKDVIDRYPTSSLIDKARYQLAESSKFLSLKSDYDQTSTIAAREEFEDFIQKYPESHMHDEAKEIVDRLKYREAENAYKIAGFYETRHILESAVIYYSEIVQNYPETEWAQKAQERIDEIKNK